MFTAFRFISVYKNVLTTWKKMWHHDTCESNYSENKIPFWHWNLFKGFWELISSMFTHQVHTPSVFDKISLKTVCLYRCYHIFHAHTGANDIIWTRYKPYRSVKWFCFCSPAAWLCTTGVTASPHQRHQQSVRAWKSCRGDIMVRSASI